MKTKVVFIGGYGRSGSTLLDRVLGSVDGFFSVGELRHIFAEGFSENRRCGCGEPFADCPFWTQVTSEAFGAVSEADVAEMLRMKAHVDRFFRIPQIVSGRGTRSFRNDLAAYSDVLRRLYRSIQAVSGADVIVDSTKDVSHGYLLSRLGGVDVRQLHLIRDVRAVAFSWQRKKFDPGSGGYMDRYGLTRTAAEWNAINALTALLRRNEHPYGLVRYESFVVDPRAAVRRILELAGEGHRPDPFEGPRRVVLGEAHTVAGNPMRFKQGEIEIRADEEWREAMAAPSRALVTSLSWPSLLRYGFV